MSVQEIKNTNESEKLSGEQKKISNLSSLLQKGKNNPLLNINLSLLSNKEVISNLISKNQKESQKAPSNEQKAEIPPLNFAPKSNFVRGMRPSTLSRTIKVQQNTKINLMEKLYFNGNNELNEKEKKNENNNIPNTNENTIFNTQNKSNHEKQTKENQIINNNTEYNNENLNNQSSNSVLNKRKRSLLTKNANENILNSAPQKSYKKNNEDIKPIPFNLNHVHEHINVRNYYSFKQCHAVKEYAYREDQNIGNEETMEDKGKSIENFMNDSSQMLFMLFDGHGGETVSTYLQNNFAKVYKENILLYIKNNNSNYIENALKDTFNHLNNQIRKLNLSSMGSTACIVHLIWENPSKLIIYNANCGDTRVSLIHTDFYKRLSKDHRGDNKDEKKRIIKSGGMIVNGRVMGALMLTRAFGDFELSPFGVIENPYVNKTEIDLNIKNQFLIIACDGIWDLNNENEFQQMIIFDNDCESLCQKIIKETLRKDAWDNLSVFCIKLT